MSYENLASLCAGLLFVVLILWYCLRSERKSQHSEHNARDDAADKIIKEIAYDISRHHSACSDEVASKEQDNTLSFSNAPARERYIVRLMIEQRSKSPYAAYDNLSFVGAANLVQEAMSHGKLTPYDVLMQFAMNEWKQQRGICSLQGFEAMKHLHIEMRLHNLADEYSTSKILDSRARWNNFEADSNTRHRY